MYLDLCLDSSPMVFIKSMKCIFKKTTLYPMFFASMTMPGLKPLVLCRILSTDPLPSLIPGGRGGFPTDISPYCGWASEILRWSMVYPLQKGCQRSVSWKTGSRNHRPYPFWKNIQQALMFQCPCCVFSWENQFHSRLGCEKKPHSRLNIPCSSWWSTL